LLALAYHGTCGQEEIIVYVDFGMDVVEKPDEMGLKIQVFI